MIIKFLKRAIVSVRYGFAWSKALDLSSKRKPLESNEILLSVEKKIHRIPIEHELLKASNYTFAADFDRAQSTLEPLPRRISESRIMSKYDKEYLLDVCAFYGDICNNTLDHRYISNDLSKVSGHLKSNFPLKFHPNWIDSKTG